MLRLEFYLFIAEKPINSQFIYANVTSAEEEASSINVTSKYFVTRIANDFLQKFCGTGFSHFLYLVLFVCSLRPINNLSDINGQVFLG